MVTRLSGGLTPADGSDPRTFPAIWNATAVDIETAESEIDTLQSTVTANGTAITALQGSAVALGSAIDVIEAWDLDDLNDVTVTSPTEAQVLAYSTAVSGWVNADAAAGGGGKILQVVSVTTTNTTTTTSATPVVMSDLSLSITPSSASSKIMAFLVIGRGDNNTSSVASVVELYRGGSSIGAPQSSTFDDGNNYGSALAVNFLDSPSTTSSITYAPYIFVTGGTGSFRRGTLTLMEVDG